jgi:hypothetical protein
VALQNRLVVSLQPISQRLHPFARSPGLPAVEMPGRQSLLHLDQAIMRIFDSRNSYARYSTLEAYLGFDSTRHRGSHWLRCQMPLLALAGAPQSWKVPAAYRFLVLVGREPGLADPVPLREHHLHSSSVGGLD